MAESSTQTSAELWYSISVTVAPETTEAIEYAFNSLEAVGTEINYLKAKNSQTATVIGYFNELPDGQCVQDELHYALSAYGFSDEAALQVERSRVENADWLAEWKKHWKPTTIGGFVIAPSWSEVDEGDRIVVRIEPNMAFGTGTHETTQLCLETIEKYYKPGDSFLDVGTGTGILAIAAAKLNLKFDISNSKLIACDTDADSIAIAKENAVTNDVGGAIEFNIGSISADAPAFDFICANLTLDVILPILALLTQKARKTLVLSGILVDQKPEIVAALAELGFADWEIKEAGEWISCVVNSKS